MEGRYPYLWLDAKVERVREGGGVRHKALVVAYGVHETGRREVIGIDVGEAETEAFWCEFLRGLLARGLDGVLLCVSDAHEGLKKAIAQVLGCPWQRCTVHFLRDMQGHVHRSQQQMVAAAIRHVFAVDDAAEARTRLAGVVAGLETAAPKVALLLEAAEEELLAFMAFPREHWTKLRSTNPLERLNKEIARRSDVVGIYPNDASLVRLAGLCSSSRTTNGSWAALPRRSRSPDSTPRSRPAGRSTRRRSSGRWSCSPPDDPDDDQELHHVGGLAWPVALVGEASSLPSPHLAASPRRCSRPRSWSTAHPET